MAVLMFLGCVFFISAIQGEIIHFDNATCSANLTFKDNSTSCEIHNGSAVCIAKYLHNVLNTLPPCIKSLKYKALQNQSFTDANFSKFLSLQELSIEPVNNSFYDSTGVSEIHNNNFIGLEEVRIFRMKLKVLYPYISTETFKPFKMLEVLDFTRTSGLDIDSLITNAGYLSRNPLKKLFLKNIQVIQKRWQKPCSMMT